MPSERNALFGKARRETVTEKPRSDTFWAILESGILIFSNDIMQYDVKEGRRLCGLLLTVLLSSSLSKLAFGLRCFVDRWCSTSSYVLLSPSRCLARAVSLAMGLPSSTSSLTPHLLRRHKKYEETDRTDSRRTDGRSGPTMFRFMPQIFQYDSCIINKTDGKATKKHPHFLVTRKKPRHFLTERVITSGKVESSI